MADRPTLSVIIPSYRSRHLDQVVTRARSLSPIEIIVVDSSPEPIAPDDEGVKLISLSDSAYAGEARNIGARRARGDILLFLDSDVVPTAQGLDAVRRRLPDLGDAIVCGVYDDHRRDEGFVARLQNVILKQRHLYDPGAVPWGSSSHFLMRRAVFERVGGFNPFIASYEDVEFFARCSKAGFQVSVDASFEAAHLKTLDLPGLFGDYLRKAYRAIQIRRTYPHVFAGVASRLGPAMLASWLASALLPPAIVLSLVAPLPPIWAAAGIAALALFPLFLAPLTFPSLGGMERVRALVPFHAIGLASLYGAGAGLIAWLWKGLVRRIGDVWFLAVAAKRVFFRASGLPIQIIQYVTARCNLRCSHCFYKETLDAPDAGEISLGNLDRLTKEIGPLLWYSLGGGEPILRKDLRQITEIVHRNCRPRIFSIPTNGWYVERTYRYALETLQRLPNQTILLFFSIDGTREIHDNIRGRDSYDRVGQTIERLRPLKKLYPNLFLNVTTTVTPDNAPVAAQVIDTLIDDFRPNAISINLFRYHALEHPPLPAEVIEGYKAATERYAQRLREGKLDHYSFFAARVLRAKEVIQKELIYRVAKYDEFLTPCQGGTLSYVIMENGSLKPCEILADTLGQVASAQPGNDFKARVTGKDARSLRRRIKQGKCRCTYECAMTTNVLFSWPMSGYLAREVGYDTLGIGSKGEVLRNRERLVAN